MRAFPVPEVGRLLTPFMMFGRGVTRTVSAYYGEAVHLNRDDYIDQLKRPRTSGDFADWVRHFAHLLETSAELNLRRLERLSGLRAAWLERIAAVRSHSVVRDVLDLVFRKPAFTVGDALDHLRGEGTGRGTFASVNNAIEFLAERGVLRQVEAQRRNRLFVCQDIVELFDRAPRRQASP